MPIPPKVVDLIERFDEHRDAYRSPEYNETQVRREFIDPMFEALGWDIHNRLGFAEQFKQVVHEDSIRIGGAAKAPDYSFRLGGRRIFFLEAKKPSVNLREDPSPAYQLRRYAWTAKLPVSILSDFEEFIVYDTRVKPVLGDKASTARVLYIPYAEYPKRWEEMAALFSPQAIQKGALDKYVESTTKKRGTAEVDDAFLAEIEEWRDLLARNTALRNSGISQRELNYAVQTTIDRIVFLRICEDRAIEPYAQLMALQNGSDVYARLRVLYERADERYNSGLFHFHKEKDRPGAPDTLTPGLDIDDKVLKAIIKRLYYPESPYEFSVLPAEILGQVYERFLGSVIRLTAGGQAKVEQKPEVRKAGGVYYTPSYIVDYIVKHTVGKLLEGKTPQEVAGVTESWRPSKTGRPLAILDPACGSGSFLLGAYQYLLDWHLEYYSKDTAKWSTGKGPRIYQDHRGVWRLATSERKRILLANIYGVDIDAQAVEVTKLSLLLRVLEGENAETLQKQFTLFHERALPDLANNIKCGNSLIGPDFYQGRQTDFDEEESYRINAFDWNAEFPDITKSGGFDAVIGNPPWGALLSEPELEYLRQRNRDIIVRMIDSFMYFLYQSSLKLQYAGHLGMILPDVILYQQDNEKLRRFLLDGFAVNCILNMGDVFDKVTRPASILVLERAKITDDSVTVADFTDLPRIQKRTELQDQSRYAHVQQFAFLQYPGVPFVTKDVGRYAIWTRIAGRPHRKLKDLVDKDGIQRGVSPDLKEAFLVDTRTAEKWNLEQARLRRAVTGGKQVKRYSIERSDILLIYTRREDDFTRIPNICRYIDQFKNRITCKEVKEKKHPLYALHRARDEHIFLKPKKLLGVITGDRIVLALDEERVYPTDGLYLFATKEALDSSFLLGILNSQLYVFLYRLLSLEQGRVLAQVKPTLLAQLPIPVIDCSDNTQKASHDKMVSLVQRMLDLHKRLQTARTEHERGVLERQIAATDDEIDHLVYELYDLTTVEIAIIEESPRM